jgi:hypothetical protein
VRIGLAIEPPDSTAFFDSARVLLIGETNQLSAQFSSTAIAQRSRLRIAPVFEVGQEPGKDDLSLIYKIKVPGTIVHGDHTDLALEADGMQMSHARPQLLKPAVLRFPDAIDVHLTAASALPLFPATLPVNQRAGRDITVSLRNNAPEIRNFQIEPRAEGLEFLPPRMNVAVGASVSRDVSFRVIASEASPGLHAGTVAVSGATAITEPVQFVVIPANGAVAYSMNNFAVIENAKTRASFIPGRWVEFIGKDNNQNLLASGGVAFTPGPITAGSDSLTFGTGQQRTLKLSDLEQLIPKH